MGSPAKKKKKRKRVGGNPAQCELQSQTDRGNLKKYPWDKKARCLISGRGFAVVLKR